VQNNNKEFFSIILYKNIPDTLKYYMHHNENWCKNLSFYSFFNLDSTLNLCEKIYYFTEWCKIRKYVSLIICDFMYEKAQREI